MRMKTAVMVVALVAGSGCVGVAPLRLGAVIERAHANEVAAVDEAISREIEVTGKVVDLAFERHSDTEVTVNTTAAPVGTAVVSTTRATKGEVHTSRPYADVESDGIKVRCYFSDTGQSARLSNGSTATLTGLFYALRRNEDSFRIWLKSCHVNETR